MNLVTAYKAKHVLYRYVP